MNHILPWTFKILALLAAGLFTLTVGSDLASAEDLAPCPENLSAEEGELTCMCSAEAASSEARVWGNDTYTADSSVCLAAVHLGLIDEMGGEVTVVTAPGCKSYKGTTRNDVTTQSYGRWSKSFYFPAYEGPNCGPKDGQETKGIADCPATFKGQAGSTIPLTCHCPKGKLTGSVWGTRTYTADSSICAAARHAGVIEPAGGIVTVNELRGCSSYKGTEKNGVTSRDYGKWGDSFFFPMAGAGDCP